MVSFNRISASVLRSAGLRISLLSLTLASLLLPAAVNAQQTFTGGGAVSLTSTQTTSSSSTLTIAGATGSSIATISVTLTGVTSNGTGDDFSLLPTTFLLQAPNGGASLILLGATGDGTDGDDQGDSGSGLSNVNITIQDGKTAAPNGSSSIWPHTGSLTVAPSSYWQFNNGINPPLGSAIDWPSSDGSATLTGRFVGTGINNGDKWTLTLNNGDETTTPVSVTSWSMTVTYGTSTPTSTAVSSSQNPAFTTSPNNSVTLTATLTPSTGPTGTVAFTANGTTISGCGSSSVGSGKATCTTTALSEGYNDIEAVYSGGGGYGASSGGTTQLIEVHPTQSSNTWCNNTTFTGLLNGTPIAYPVMIPVSGYAGGATVGNVTLELEGVTQGAAGEGISEQYLLVAPDGTHNLDFLDDAFLTNVSSPVNLFISDAATLSPNHGTPVSNDIYLPYDGAGTLDEFPASNSPIVDSNIPAVPGTINFATPHGGSNSYTLQQAFSGAPANGDWALYATGQNGSDALTETGFCITLDVNSGTGTTTALTSSAQRGTTGASITLSATVTATGTPVTSGTVEFKDETTGTVLAAAATLNSSGLATVSTSTLVEGDHNIVATYSGTGTYNTSFNSMYQRIDDSTGVTTVSSNQWQFCNTGKITIAAATSGAESPNPSNIFVSNIPGTLKTATLTLTNFSILVADQLDNTESLVVGPTGTDLDFFSNTAGGTLADEATAGNYIFADAASALVSSGSGNIVPGTYKPTSYVGTDNANDVFTADPGGFYTLPGTINYSAGRASSTFNSEFNAINPNGTWSLYFNSPNANAAGTGAAGGWCVNLTENQPTVTVAVPSADAFLQGQSDQQITVNITNSGTTGSTGDPTGGSDPLTVTDTLNAAFTFNSADSGGTGWSCSAVGQAVSCTNDSSVADNGGTYPQLTIAVNVSAGATGPITNSVSASGAGVSATGSNTETISIDVPPAITSGNNTTFTVGTHGTFSVTTTGTPAATLSESGALPSGVTFVNNGNGTATLSGTPAAGSGGTYALTITADNGTTNANQTFTLTVDQAPAITSGSSTTFSVGTAGSFTATASGFPAATFTETGPLPSGVTLSTGGLLSGTPAAGSGGVYPITITASNGVGTAATQSFTLTVDQAPVITSGAATTFTVGTAGSFSVTATGNPAATFSETGALPTGVTFSSAGLLSGTPSAGTGGAYTLNITASNGVGTPGTQTFTLTVNQSPAITSGASTTFTVGTAGSFSVTATGNPAATFSETGALPTGVTFSSAGLLSGTPSAGTGGAYTLNITASNGVGTNATQTFTLTVKQAPAITSGNSTAFTSGTLGTFAVTTSGSPVSSLSESGPLPSGVTFTDNGNGTATITGTASLAGSYPITITAQNGVAPNATQSFTLTVNPGAATHLVVVGKTVTSNIAFRFTINAYDAAGNVATSYNGTVALSSSDPGFVNLGPFTLTNGTTGGASAALKTAGTETITATDTSNGTITGTGTFTVLPGAVQNLEISTPPSTYVGSPISMTVTAHDLYGNVATSYGGSVVFTSSDPNAILPSGSIAITNGTGTFSATMETVGTQTITATDSANSLVVQSASIAVSIPTLVVTTPNDDAGLSTNCTLQTTPGSGTDASCSLRDALLFAANAGSGGITFDSTAFASAKTITLSNATTLTIPSNTTITGPTTGSGATLANLVTVNGSAASTVFTVQSGVTSASFSSLTVTNGSAGSGGGISNAGTLAVTNSTISGNNSNGSGAGVFNTGTLSLTGSTLSGNTVLGTPAAGGGIYNTGTLTVSNSTIAGNSATGGASGVGGGIAINGGSTTIGSTTISGNSSDGSGGGISVTGASSVVLGYDIVSGNSSTTNADVDGTVTDNGGNQIGASGINLAPLAIYGGPTKTMVPMPGSPAICGSQLGDGSVVPNLSVDQRGNSLDSLCASGTIDAGSVQTSYALAFTVQPPSSTGAGVALSPAPAVTLTESGAVFAPATSSVTMTDADSGLSASGTNSVALASGTATFTNLIIGAAETGDTLTASLSLNPNTEPPLTITSSSSTGVTVSALSTLISPTPGSVLGTSNITFQWGTGAGATEYQLYLGTTGPGSSNLAGYRDSGNSVTLISLPANGVTVYARLSSYIGGVWQFIDYTYTESPAPIAATLTTPTPGLGTVLGASNVTFQWTTGSGINLYQLNLSAIAPGQSELFSFVGSATSATVSNLPAKGQVIYARLSSYVNGAWQSHDYQYTEVGSNLAAVITSPASGLATVLGTSNVAFQWTTGTGITEYQLSLGTTPGAQDLFFYKGKATSVTVPTLPANGQIVYARLYSEIDGTWVSGNFTYYNDYGYTESGTPAPAALTSPTPGRTTVLGTSNVAFQWNAGKGVSNYQLTLGTTGAGASDLYIYKGTATTATVTSLPSKGLLVYARLSSLINGVWQNNDYLYTETGATALAALQTPTPGLGTVLGASNVSFGWTTGSGATLYQLTLSAIAPGQSELFIYKGSATSTTAVSLPANGVTVYARLYSYINGTWQYNDYVYTEQ